MDIGQRVEVRSQFDRSWSNGFEIEEVLDSDDGRSFRVRRLSDNMVLPRDFDEDDVRRERRGGMWWY